MNSNIISHQEMLFKSISSFRFICSLTFLLSLDLKGLGQTATNIVQVAKEEHEQKGVTGAVGGVLRQVPATVVQPLILATEATSNVLGGVRNQILPDARREAADKWRASP